MSRIKNLFWYYAILNRVHFGKYNDRKTIMLRFDRLGDCVMFSDAAHSIREYYNDREMHLACLAQTKPFFERMGIFDEIIDIDCDPFKVDFTKLSGLISRLQRQQYDLLLVPQVSRAPWIDIVSAAVRCNKRIAMEVMPNNSSEKWNRMVSFLYDKIIPYPRGMVHEFDYNAAFVRGIGVTGYKTKRAVIPYNTQHFVRANYYVFFPGSASHEKMWPVGRYAKLADHIFSRTGLTGVIMGTAAEQKVSARIQALMRSPVSEAITDLAGKTTVPDVIDLIGNAEFVVANDTSGVHIACGTNTPSVAVVGGQHFQRYLPYRLEEVKPDDCLPLTAYTEMPCFNCYWHEPVIKERNPKCYEHINKGLPFDCIESITYGQVRELTDRLIDKSGLD